MKMAVAMDYVVIVVMVGILGAILFVLSTLIFLLEEAAKFLLHSLQASLQPAQAWVVAHVRHASRLRFHRHTPST
jgi:uncharacterized membrane protein YbaN (DUF454 family)